MEKIKKILTTKKAYDSALTLMNWDLETEAPELSVELTTKNIGILSELSYKLLVNDEFKKLIYSKNENELSDIDKKLIQVLKKTVFEIMGKIPLELYKEYSELKTISSIKWQEAKQKNDFTIYKPFLEKIIKLNKEIIKYRGYIGHPYSLLLDDYEEALNVEIVEEFFDKIKKELVPFIKKVTAKKNEELNRIKKIFNSKKYDVEKQRKLSKEISKILKFDFKKGVLKESEHPFTTSFNRNDVRITTHYYENNLLSSIYSTIHEVGHALYEQQINEIYDDNFLGSGVSMGIHESQSRIYENMFCKHDGFIKKLYSLIDEYFEIEITLDEFKLLINEVENTLIRTESDELTYPLHILIRYELEKEIFSNLDENVDADKLAKLWDDKYEEYLGIRPKNYSEGILQDVHWSSGLFGYFPSYALGSAYAAQIYKSMEKELNLDLSLEKLDFSVIKEWLLENIHKYGSFKTPKEILLLATKEEFNPNYYIDYLKNKFKKIYNIEV